MAQASIKDSINKHANTSDINHSRDTAKFNMIIAFKSLTNKKVQRESSNL